MNTKYIFVTGGVVSGLGKGITAASLGRLLKARDFKVTNQKFDPYINIDPGAMSPIEHGEVFVTDDGAQTDLDVGHYERFTDESLTSHSNITAGKIYRDVSARERRGGYGGITVQVVPHITDDIKSRIYKAARSSSSDIVITEVGGTVGDIESLPFIEAIRQVQHEVGSDNCLYIHVPLVPSLSSSGDMKTKPVQHSVRTLLSLGIQPHIIVCRSAHHMPNDMRAKLALFCNVPPNCVLQNTDCDSLYEIPLLLESEGLASIACEKLGLPKRDANLSEWIDIVNKAKSSTHTLRLTIVGKYVESHDAYLSLEESVRHSGIFADTSIEIDWLNPNEKDALDKISDSAAIIVYGSFDEITTPEEAALFLSCLQKAREASIPTLGINLGMHLMAVEYAQNVLRLSGTSASAEWDEKATNIIIEQNSPSPNLQDGVRLGAYPCRIQRSSLLFGAYSEEIVYERHRNAYGLSLEYRRKLSEAGLIISVDSPDGRHIEAIELPQSAHPFYVGVQFHPEYKSRPNRPAPLINTFIQTALNS